MPLTRKGFCFTSGIPKNPYVCREKSDIKINDQSLMCGGGSGHRTSANALISRIVLAFLSFNASLPVQWVGNLLPTKQDQHQSKQDQPYHALIYGKWTNSTVALPIQPYQQARPAVPRPIHNQWNAIHRLWFTEERDSKSSSYSSQQRIQAAEKA